MRVLVWPRSEDVVRHRLHGESVDAVRRRNAERGRARVESLLTLAALHRLR